MKKIVKGLTGLLSAGVASLMTLILLVQSTLPDNFYVEPGSEFCITSNLLISTRLTDFSPKIYDSQGEAYSLRLNLFEEAPVQEVQAPASRRIVVPGGVPFGITMFTEGVMVVGMSDIQVGTENINPAKNAGIKIGDIILTMNDEPVTRNSDVARFISESEGAEVKFSIEREGSPLTLYLQPIQSEYDSSYKAGIWVRDSSAGIGTLTYYDPESLSFAGLGHAICDVDTGNVMPLSSGEILDVNISGVNAGLSGKPGELKGTFAGESPIGKLKYNCDQGIFGSLVQPLLCGDPIPMAFRQEIVPGKATILATLSGNKPQSFEIEIEKVNYSGNSPTKNMVVRVTDPTLLAKTGGIVQGMSGSPIIQNEKLVGAVTHVFVNDPTRGYGIFAEIMDEKMKYVENNE
ncbi:SpoIVB peptidase [Oscillospiraceae bacterium MB08-C2-2]|nr:SpoIVB peptidase [Oscillospiraceae bacterium MB08-C2-2]